MKIKIRRVGYNLISWSLVAANGVSMAQGNYYNSLASCRNAVDKMFKDSYPIWTDKELI